MAGHPPGSQRIRREHTWEGVAGGISRDVHGRR